MRQMAISAVCAAAVAIVLAGCTKATPTADGNSTTAQTPAPAVPPKPYIEPNAIFTEIAAEYEPVLEKVGDSATVDWSRGVITASGSAKAPSAAPQERIKAQRGAEAAAVRNALLSGNGIRVDSRGKYGDLRTGMIDAEGTVTGREVVSSDWDAATLTATATVSVPMYGLAGVARLDGVPVEKAANHRALEVRDPVKEEAELIVIRAEGFAPCLLPQMEDEKGGTLFSPATSSQQPAGGHAAIFVKARSPATSQPSTSPSGRFARRITLDASMVIDRLRGAGELVLDGLSVAELQRHPDAVELLKAGRLVIIVDGR